MEREKESRLRRAQPSRAPGTEEGALTVARKKKQKEPPAEQEAAIAGSDECDTREPLSMDQPADVVARTLSEDDQDDRVRAALGLTSDDPLPDVDEETLLAYHKCLEAKLSFPFRGSYSQETGPMEDTTYSITVTGLVDPDEYDCDEFYGLFCEALVSSRGRRGTQLPLGKVEVEAGDPNQQVVDDYGYWFWNHR